MKRAMKIMAMVLFVMGMTALTSCTKDNADLIVGKWMFEKASATYEGQSWQMTAADLAAMMGVQGMSSDEFVIEFTSDGKVYASDEPEPASYTIDGSQLTVVTPEETFEMVITKLTSTTLIVEPQYNDEMPEGAKAEVQFKKI